MGSAGSAGGTPAVAARACARVRCSCRAPPAAVRRQSAAAAAAAAVVETGAGAGAGVGAAEGRQTVGYGRNGCTRCLAEGRGADLPLLMYERAGGSHEDDAFVGVPAQEVVHHDSRDDGFAETSRQANERVVLNGSEDDIALIFAKLWGHRRDQDFHR